MHVNIILINIGLSTLINYINKRVVMIKIIFPKLINHTDELGCIQCV